MAGVIGAIIAVVFLIYAFGSFAGDVANEYEQGGCLGVIAFLGFAALISVLIVGFGL